MRSARRGEVWLADLNPVRGREQAGKRPVLIVSHNILNRGPSDLALVVPITSRLRDIITHVRLLPPEGGLRTQSSCMCEALRSISRGRLIKRLGEVDRATLDKVAFALRAILDL